MTQPEYRDRSPRIHRIDKHRTPSPPPVLLMLPVAALLAAGHAGRIIRREDVTRPTGWRRGAGEKPVGVVWKSFCFNTWPVFGIDKSSRPGGAARDIILLWCLYVHDERYRRRGISFSIVRYSYYVFAITLYCVITCSYRVPTVVVQHRTRRATSTPGDYTTTTTTTTTVILL